MKDALRPALDGVSNALAPWANGRKQINFLAGYDVTAEAVAVAYPPGIYERLVRVRTAYDPRNMFRINHSIPPR